MPTVLSPNQINSKAGSANNLPLTSIDYINRSDEVIHVSLTGQIDNFSPSLWDLAETVVISTTGDVQISGFDSSTNLKSKKIINKNSTTGTIILLHEDINSTSSNRLDLNGNNFKIYPQREANIFYDNINLRWKVSFQSEREIGYNYVNPTATGAINLQGNVKLFQIRRSVVLGSQSIVSANLGYRKGIITVVSDDVLSPPLPIPTAASFSINHEDTRVVTPEHRIKTIDGSNMTAQPRDSFKLFYDDDLQRWVMI
jgi:hypothetical protein